MLAFKLAARGGRTVRELLGAMGADEWVYWQEFDRVSPVGDERIERMLAVQTSILANQWRGEDHDPVTLEQTLPDHGKARAEAEARMRRSKRWQARQAEELDAQFRAYAARRGTDGEG